MARSSCRHCDEEVCLAHLGRACLHAARVASQEDWNPEQPSWPGGATVLHMAAHKLVRGPSWQSQFCMRLCSKAGSLAAVFGHTRSHRGCVFVNGLPGGGAHSGSMKWLAVSCDTLLGSSG